MTFLPLVGALLVMLGREASAVKIGAAVSGLVFLLGCLMLSRFDATLAGFQFVEQKMWFPSLEIGYHMGIDGLSVYFVFLSALLTPICILAAGNSVSSRIREYISAFLVLETFMIGTFAALDAILFYVFFEGVLIPMFLIIGVWGGQRRIYSAFKLFLYTLLGSVLMLLAILTLYLHAGTTDIPQLMNLSLPVEMQTWLFLAFLASFAIKMPMWPVHTWLPDAHVEAPTGGSVILAGVLLKMGGYGFLRFSLPILPEASALFAPMIFGLSIVAIIYTSLVALVQQDIKKMIAYSSVAHMGYVTLGIFTLNKQGIEGAIFQMVSHGVVSAALFLGIGVLYDRLHTRDINRYGGIVKNMPVFAVIMMVFMLGSVGLPGTAGFVGEFLALLGAYQASTWVAFLAASGLVLGATYMLLFYRKVVFGPADNADAAEMPDMNGTEKFNLIPLAVLTILLGVMPNLVLNNISQSVDKLVAQTVRAPVPADLSDEALSEIFEDRYLFDDRIWFEVQP